MFILLKMNIKKISKIIAFIFIIVGLFLILGKRAWFPDFYNPIFMGVMALVAAFLIFSLRLILRPGNPEQEKILDLIQISLVAGLSFNALGALGLFQLYKFGFQYDKLLHFLNSFVFAIVFAKSYEQWRKVGFKKSIILSIIIIFLIGTIWELYELAGDTWFKTQMLGQYGEFVTEDTIWDLAMNFFGIITAAAGLSICRNNSRYCYFN